jgi:hypothetical protein
VSALALFASAARGLRFESHALADAIVSDAVTDGLDGAGRFVTEHERRVNDELCDATVLEVVDVGPADPDRCHAHQDLTGARAGNR